MNENIVSSADQDRKVKLPVEIDVIIDHHPKPAGNGTTVTLSPAGAIFVTKTFIQQHSLLRLRIKSSTKTIQTLGKVERVMPLRDGSFQVWVSFAKKRMPEETL